MPPEFAIPEFMLEVLADKNAREVLLKIAYQGPMRWSDVRDELGLHAQAYVRALDKLEESAFVRRRAPADFADAPPGKRRQIVQLEVTHLGSFLVDVWEELNKDTARLAKRHNVNLEALNC